MPAKQAGKRGDIDTFSSRMADGWGVIEWPDVAVVPRLLVHLYRALRARVITASEYEVVGFEHFSILQGGEAEAIWTSVGGEAWDYFVNVDVEEFVRRRFW